MYTKDEIYQEVADEIATKSSEAAEFIRNKIKEAMRTTGDQDEYDVELPITQYTFEIYEKAFENYYEEFWNINRKQDNTEKGMYVFKMKDKSKEKTVIELNKKEE